MQRREINRKIRELLGISGRELSERVEVTKQTISNYETGKAMTNRVKNKEVLVMKNVKIPFGLRKGVVTIISIGFGAIMGGLLSCIGQNSGEYRGMKETNEKWKAAVDAAFERAKNESEEEKTE